MLLKDSITKYLMVTLDNWLAMVSAYIGDIPIQHDNTAISPNKTLASVAVVVAVAVGSDANTNTNTNTNTLLSLEQIKTLKSQAFLKSPRIIEMLNETKKQINDNILNVRSYMKLYISSSIARVILLKPVQHDIEIMKRKLETIITCCIEPGQEKRTIQSMIVSIASEVTNGLVMQLD